MTLVPVPRLQPVRRYAEKLHEEGKAARRIGGRSCKPAFPAGEAHSAAAVPIVGVDVPSGRLSADEGRRKRPQWSLAPQPLTQL